MKRGGTFSKNYGRWAIFKEKNILNKANFSKLSSKKQQQLSGLIADLLENGFTLQESLIFLEIVYHEEKQRIIQIREHMSTGVPIAIAFKALSLSDNYVSQIHLGQTHGDLPGTFKRISKQLNDYQKQQTNLIKVLFYPCMLLLFLGMMIILMKYFLLPQMNGIEADNIGIWLIEHSPSLFISSLLLLIAGVGGLYLFLKNKSAVKQLTWLMKFPLLRGGISYYYTAFFSYEWGKLLVHGIELKEVLVIMQQPENMQLMREIGADLAKGIQKGEPLADLIARYPFFNNGFSVMIRQGEIKGKLGVELLFYGETLWEELIKKIEKFTSYLQPFIFLIVALLIVTVYAALLLPIYQNMEGFL